MSIAAPTLVVQGMADVTVLPKDTDDAVRQLCTKRNVVAYKPFAGADHDGSMTAGAQTARDWIDARFAGKKAESNCQALPKAGNE